MTPAPKSLARGGLFCCSTLILEAISSYVDFHVRTCFGKIGFGTGGRFMIRCRFCFVEKMIFPKSAPEVSGTIPGPFPTHSGPFRTHSGQKSFKKLY